MIEVTPAGEIVWRYDAGIRPFDADRLPNGNTIVAGNRQVREFDPRGDLVWKKEARSWFVEVNRY